MNQMGADIVRWMFCEQVPSQNINFGYRAGRRRQAAAADALELGSLPRRLRQHRGVPAAVRGLLAGPDGDLQPLDRWLLARTQAFIARRPRRTSASGRRRVTDAFERFVDDLSNWYIRRSRRRFYGDDPAAFRTLWYALARRSG